MELLRLLRRESTDLWTKLVAAALVSGILHSGLISLIINIAGTISPDQAALRLLLLFGIMMAALLGLRHFVLTRSAMLMEQIICKVRLRIIDKLREADLLFFERLGTAPVYKAFSSDTMALTNTAMIMVAAFSNIILLVFATVYIGYLSRTALILAVACIGGGVITYWNLRVRVHKSLQASARIETRFYDLLNHVLAGFKEIKMNRSRNDDLYENHVVETAAALKGSRVAAHCEFALGGVSNEGFFYLLLASIIFILPSFASQGEHSGVIMKLAAVVLFILQPLTQIIGAVPSVFQGNHAVANLRQLEESLDQAVDERPRAVPKPSFSTPRSFQQITCKDLQFRYESDANGDAFGIGPLNLAFTANEILFIVGGNGSGKSTLLKLLTGLYSPQAGLIALDGHAISKESLERYRGLFSIVFTDFHLFDQLYGMKTANRDRFASLLEQMEIGDKTGLDGQRFTTTDLSTGQRKRLALVVALLEEHPILVFDEVAADQDPGFRKYFYEILLPQLKREGKSIIAATHDDRYFHIADRVLKMDYGKLAACTP